MPKECVEANFADQATNSCKKRSKLVIKKNSSSRRIGELYPILKLVIYSEKKMEWREILGMERSYLLYR
jgi:hypothetical protein